MDLIKEFLLFLRNSKKWWLAPLVLAFLLFAAAIVFTEGSRTSSFIYTLF